MARSRTRVAAGVLLLFVALTSSTALGAAPAAPTGQGNGEDIGKASDPLIPFNAEGTDPGTSAHLDSKPKGPAEAHDYEADWVEEGTPASENSGAPEADPNPRKVPVRPPVAETDPNPRKVIMRAPEEITDVCLVVCDDARRFQSPLSRKECATPALKGDPRCASSQALRKSAQDQAPRSCRPLDFSAGCDLP